LVYYGTNLAEGQQRLWWLEDVLGSEKCGGSFGGGATAPLAVGWCTMGPIWRRGNSASGGWERY